MSTLDWSSLKKKFTRTAVPIYQMVADFLREQILSGKLSPGEKMPPETSLADFLGISFLTLRRSLKILADEHLITQCRGRGTFVSFHQETQHLTIGVVIPELTMGDDIYIMRSLAYLNQALSHHQGGELVILPFNSRENFLDRIHAARCNALVVLATSDIVYKALGNRMFKNFPMVFISSNRRLPTALKNKFVIFMMHGAVREAVRHLYQCGHRKIAFFSARLANSHHLIDNEKEFIDTCDELKITRKFMRIYEHEDWFQGVYGQTLEMMKSQERPTAVLTPGFTFSYAAWQAIQVAGLRIPQDISFIGFDVNRTSNAFMSAMMHPFEEAMEKAVELVIGMQDIGKHLSQRSFFFPAVYQENGSCKKITSP